MLTFQIRLRPPFAQRLCMDQIPAPHLDLRAFRFQRSTSAVPRCGRASGYRRMDLCRGDRQVVQDLCHRGPNRQRGEPLGIEWYDDRVAGANVNTVAAVEPASGPGMDAAVGSYHIDAFAISLPGRTAALLDIVVTRHTALEQVRCGILDFPQHHDLLALLRHDELIAIAKNDVVT